MRELINTATMLDVPDISSETSAIGANEPTRGGIAADAGALDERLAVEDFRNDVGYADQFVKRFASEIRFCAAKGQWLLFGPEHGWRVDESNMILAKAADYARELYQRAAKLALTMQPDGGATLVKAVVRLGDRKRIEPALKFAASDHRIGVQPGQLDGDAYLVGASNGVIDLRDGSFRPHDHAQLVTRRLGTAFDPNARCPAFDAFLAEVQPDPVMRAFLQRLSGYSLSGAVREHVLPFHYGTGANGKGTFLEQCLLRLAGTYGAKLTDDFVYANAKGRSPHLEIANLCGARLALGEENSEGGALNEAMLKAVSGGDKLKGRFHYGNFVEYFPTFKMHLVGNHKPRIIGIDDGFWRRFLLIDWPVQIPPERRDGTLKDKLAAEFPGILNWALTGARDWLAHGLQPPASCTAATINYRGQSDKLSEFIEDHFTAVDDGAVTKASVYAAYQDWCQAEGIRQPMSKRGLGIQLANRGWQDGAAGHERQKVWRGFRRVLHFGSGAADG